jgi:hypothetical protein
MTPETRPLWIAVGVSLVLNLLLLIVLGGTLNRVNRQAEEMVPDLRDASAGLQRLGSDGITLDIPIDETIEIDALVPVSTELTVPFRTSIPIQQEFTTTVEVLGPLGIVVPLDVTIPVDIQVPIAVDVPVSIDDEVDVQFPVPIALDVPVTIDLSDTDLANFASSLSAVLDRTADAIED